MSFRLLSRTKCLTLLFVSAVQISTAQEQKVKSTDPIQSVPLAAVKINDGFWSPKFKVWTSKTIYDVLDKLEGKYEPDQEDIIKEKTERGRTRNAFLNFDLVAQGKKGIGTSDGPPWYDGLVYETIRGGADLLVSYPDAKLEKKLDAYIDRIAAAQNADPEGYINTYTTLNRPTQRWGLNGGDDRWQHDVYNAGMLVEAGVHYYQATGKTKLLGVAVKMANYVTKVMGAAPKLNVIPAHAGPEEAFFKLYLLFKTTPNLKQKLGITVHEDDYYAIVKYWIEKRGVFADADGSRARISFGSYNQDHIPVFDQQTIEGHAVRATLLGTGITAVANYSKDGRYLNTADHYWDNMIGKRMFITGGEGAIANDEKFGADYFLPESAYLETCASIGAAFFSQQMNAIHANGKYIDEFERVIYNNLLSSVAADGQHYHYENPLISKDRRRWNWHSCPCCPPMFLKMIGALPQYIYGHNKNTVFVNLFIGSDAHIDLENTKVGLQQTTSYPWKGGIRLQVNPEKSSAFSIALRIPGWAMGNENPFELYHSTVNGKLSLTVNGKAIEVKPVNGYVSINRNWKKGDIIELSLPVEPRLVTPNNLVKTISGKTAIAAGPIVYALEGVDNPETDVFHLNNNSILAPQYKAGIAGGINVIAGKSISNSMPINFTAIPFYAIGNRGVYPYKVWLD
jgi:DUF1680 family protein